MRPFYAVFGLIVLMSISVQAQILVYPQGMLNPRVPMIATCEGGATGKAFPAKGVMLGYDFASALGKTTQGKIDFELRSDLSRQQKWSLVLVGKKFALAIGVLPASKGRLIQLVWMKSPELGSQFKAGSVIHKAVSQVASVGTWRQATLQWDTQQATLVLQGKTISTLSLKGVLSPTQLMVEGWSIDELTLTAQGTLKLDWEKDYAARLTPAAGLGVRDVTADLLGFDTFVVSVDSASRHFPMIQLNNPTASSQQVRVGFNVTRELTGKPWQWQQTFILQPHQTVLAPVTFPEKLGSDVYHLQAHVTVGDVTIDRENKHFLHSPKRDEPTGPSKFGLHDSNVRAFGFWPDALPIHTAHNYLRWGYVQGPGWVKDWDGNKYGLDPALPASQWNWNNRIDWAIDAGRELLVCVQAVPYSDWARASDYPNMRKYSWGKVGGQPNIERYRVFLREAAQRYKGKVTAWEIENEPNSSQHTPSDRTADYVQVCKAVYDEIKNIDPETLVLGISGTSQFQPFMEKVFKLGGRAYMDGVTWHTYTSPNTPDKVGLPKLLQAAVQTVQQNKPNAPIWNSETGVSIALRYDVTHAIPKDQVAQKVSQRDPSFVNNGWMGAVFDEWHGSASLVTNVIYNFRAGVQKYVFFGWNPDWPVHPKWAGHSTHFNLLSCAADGTRTPSLGTLAVATLTTQMQGALLKANQPIKLDGIAGGIFDKVNGGKLAVIWAPAATRSVMLQTDAQHVEVVDMFGQSRMLTVTDGMIAFDVTELPAYVHVPTGKLAFSPSPIKRVVLKADGATSGTCDVTVVNRLSVPFKGQLQVTWLLGQGQLTPASQPLTLGVGQSRVVKFAYAIKAQPQDTAKQTSLSIMMKQDAPHGHKPVSFTSTVQLPTKPVVRVPVTSPIRLHQSQKAMLRAMKKAGAKTLSLDRLKQVKLGHPPALASLQDPKWWGGPQELSASVQLAADKKGLVIYMDVLDIAARLPRSWPSVKGSVIELFFDFRKPGKGLGDPVYGPQTFQVLLKPQLTATVSNVLVWSPQLDTLSLPAFSQYDKATNRYWLVMRLPWSKVPRFKSKQHQVFGFDVAINAAPMGKPGRKTQMILFGTAANARSAADFGQIVLKP